MRSILFVLTCAILLPVNAVAHIHAVRMNPDQILLIKTALGIATILETPESIQSAIIGDQSGFKIEYLDHAVTIKPLRFGARTNLYLQTSSRRYDLRLETGRQEVADYIVYLKATESKPPSTWKEVSRTVAGKNLTLKVLRVAHLPHGFLLVDMRILGKSKLKLTPDSIWLTQGKETKVINSLFLSTLDVSKDRPVMLGLTLLKSDLVPDHAIAIALRDKNETIKVELPSEAIWK